MGKCLSKEKKPDTFIEEEIDEFDDLPTLKFNIKISQIKISELKNSFLKSNSAGVSFKLKNSLFSLPEVQMTDSSLCFSDKHSFVYEATLSRMNRDKLEILVTSKNKPLSSTEIPVKSIIDGPELQNLALICSGLIVGRISLVIEMLEESSLLVTPVDLKCELGDHALGQFSVSLKFLGESSLESKHSVVLEDPQWKFSVAEENLPEISLPVTMKGIRDAALQIRVYKHHKSACEVTAECWISFTKLFAEDMEAIYRTESFLESNHKEQGTRLDFEKLIKSMKRVHSKKINENLWLCGRKIGTVQGMIRLSGIPTFMQLISGVNTEKGYLIQTNVYMSEENSKGKEDLPKKIREISKITEELQESVQYKPGKGGLNYEKEMLKKKKENFEELYKILQSSQKDSMISFIYKNEKSLIKSQEVLIKLGEHLVEYSKLVNYDIKPSYFKCLTYLIKRGELDIGFLSEDGSRESLKQAKIAVAEMYLKFLHNVCSLSLSRMAFKGVDKVTEEFVYTALAISWFRIPEFVKKTTQVLKEKDFHTVEEWRKTDIDLDDELTNDISGIFEWKNFYTLIRPGFNKDSFEAALFSETWQQKIQKRGLSFFNFLKQYIFHILDQTKSGQILWSSIPGYKLLLKVYLLELKERKITEYPEALVEAGSVLLNNSKLLNVFVRIIFAKTNIYDFASVQECFRVLNLFFSAVFKYNQALPSTFDVEFFLLGLSISLDDENGLNVAKCLSFIYNQYHLLRGQLRAKLIAKLLLKKKLKKFFFHWCLDLRSMLYHLILYRIYSLQHFSFEPPEDNELNQQIIQSLKKKIRSFSPDSLNSDQKPYFQTAIDQFEKLSTSYKTWEKELNSNTGKLFGCSDSSPYPQVCINFKFEDLSEKKLEEQW